MTPEELFQPSRTPEDMIRSGMFGGVYWRRKDLADWKEFPAEWFDGLEQSFFDAPKRLACNNHYGCHAGTFQSEWERNGWINSQDPRGWVQWYFRYHLGRRTDDDERQIVRWHRFASVRGGRWVNRLYNQCRVRGDAWGDETISPVIRQSLLHWAYEPSAADYSEWKAFKHGEV